jgi:thioredoxin 1
MVAKNDLVTEITSQEFPGFIENKLVLVDFFAEWCMPCVMLTPVLEEIAGEIKNVKFAKINIDGNQETAAKYGVSSIPCLIIFKDGEEIDRIIGAQPSEVIEEKIKEHL